MTLDGLRRGQVTWRDALKNVLVDYTYALDRRSKTSVDIRREREGRLVAPNFTFSMSIAFKGDKRYNKYEISSGKKPTTYINAFNGTQTRSYEPLRVLGQIHPGEREGLENNVAWYFDMLSIPTGPGAEKLMETNIYVPTALKMANYIKSFRRSKK